VWLDDGGRKAGRKDELEGDGALVEALGDQVRYLKEQRDIRTEKLREHRRLLGGLIERMLELEGPVGCQGLLRAARRLLRSSRRPCPINRAPRLRVRRFTTAHRGAGGEDCSAELPMSLISGTSP